MTAAELTNRSNFGDFLHALGLVGQGMEIGAYQGEFSREVLAHWGGAEWHLLDPWKVDQDFLQLNGGVPWDMEQALAAVKELTEEDSRAILHRMRSKDWSDDSQFDVVYIDGSHDYVSVSRDLAHWWQRLKPGGLLSGHDYLDQWHWSRDINRGNLFGVRTAVDQFAAQHDRVVATTEEEFPTWWFLKPISTISPEQIAVVSGSTGDVVWAETVAANHRRYCQIHGYRYEHVAITHCDRPPAWAKLAIVRQALESAPFVLWIDADAIFQRMDLSLSRFWDGVSPFVFFKDSINGLNSGVFFARRCAETLAFLDRWEQMTEFNDHPWWENAALLEIERRGELMGLVLPHRLANSYPHMPGCWASDDFIAHFAGLLPPVRESLLRDFVARSLVSVD